MDSDYDALWRAIYHKPHDQAIWDAYQDYCLEHERLLRPLRWGRLDGYLRYAPVYYTYDWIYATLEHRRDWAHTFYLCQHNDRVTMSDPILVDALNDFFPHPNRSVTLSYWVRTSNQVEGDAIVGVVDQLVGPWRRVPTVDEERGCDKILIGGQSFFEHLMEHVGKHLTLKWVVHPDPDETSAQ